MVSAIFPGYHDLSFFLFVLSFHIVCVFETLFLNGSSPTPVSLYVRMRVYSLKPVVFPQGLVFLLLLGTSKFNVFLGKLNRFLSLRTCQLVFNLDMSAQSVASWKSLLISFCTLLLNAYDTAEDFLFAGVYRLLVPYKIIRPGKLLRAWLVCDGVYQCASVDLLAASRRGCDWGKGRNPLLNSRSRRGGVRRLSSGRVFLLPSKGWCGWKRAWTWRDALGFCKGIFGWAFTWDPRARWCCRILLARANHTTFSVVAVV